ncbi:hypothetical protein Tco_1430687 [Tanacetum coccineum]
MLKPVPRVHVILRRTLFALQKLSLIYYEEKIIFKSGSDEFILLAEKSKKARIRQFAHAISVLHFSKDVPFKWLYIPFCSIPPSSSPVYSNPLFEFDDNFTSSNVNPLFNEIDEDVEIENSNVLDSDEPVLLNTPLSDKVESFALEDDIDEIDAFLTMEVSSNFEEVISIQKETSDPLHHEFAGELITLPSRIVREHEDYLNHMTLLCEIEASRPLGYFHASPSAIIESLPIPVEENDPIQEEIKIFLSPDDLIPPSVENDDSENEDNSILSPEEESFNVDHQDDPSIPRPPPEPPDVEKCLEPEAGILITKVFKGVSKPHDFMADILPTLPTLVSDLTFILFLSSFLSFGSEDTIFDPGIITFPFSYLEPVAFSMEVSCSKCCSP